MQAGKGDCCTEEDLFDGKNKKGALVCLAQHVLAAGLAQPEPQAG